MMASCKSQAGVPGDVSCDVSHAAGILDTFMHPLNFLGFHLSASFTWHYRGWGLCSDTPMGSEKPTVVV